MLNKVMIIGNLGKDPEMRFTPSGDPVTNFSVATTSKSKGIEYTEWFNVVVWGKKAEACNQYLSKGSKVYVDGRQQTKSWEGQDGQKRYKTELNAFTVEFLSTKQGENTDTGGGGALNDWEPEDDIY